MSVRHLVLILLSFALITGRGVGSDVDQFGGSLLAKKTATGYFRVEEINRRWFFITPDGHPYIALGANHVGSYLKKQAQAGGLLARYADDPDASANALLDNLKGMGLNAGDAYHPEPRYDGKLPWVLGFHYLPDGGKQPPNVFDPEAMKLMHEHVKSCCEKIADNPWVMGVAGPDLPRWDSSYVHPYRIAKPDSSARKGYEMILKIRHPDGIDSLNTAYQTKFADWEALSQKPRLNFKIETDRAKSDDEAFLGYIASKHFAAVRAACKAGAPNHLYFGERTQLRVIPDTVLQAMAGHIDVFCTQSLIRLPKSPPEWQVFQKKHYDREFDLVQTPMVIIDWAAPFTLGQKAVKTDYGTLKPEAESSEDAAQFIHDAFDCNYMIGLFICQVIGTHGNDKFFINAKRTYLKDDGLPYATRTKMLGEANRAAIQKRYQTLIE